MTNLCKVVICIFFICNVDFLHAIWQRRVSFRTLARAPKYPDFSNTRRRYAITIDIS